MELKITGKNTPIAESLQLFTERKISKLEKFAKHKLRGTIILSEQTAKKTSKSCHVEVVLDTKGQIFSAKDNKENFYIAVDSVVEKLRRQLKKFKNKRIKKIKDSKAQLVGSVTTPTQLEPPNNLAELEVTSFSAKPLNVGDALFNLKNSRRAFFLFVNEDLTINCVYRKDHGRFGLIVPENS